MFKCCLFAVLMLLICGACDVARFWSLRFTVMFWFVDLVYACLFVFVWFILVCSVLFELC